MAMSPHNMEAGASTASIGDFELFVSRRTNYSQSIVGDLYVNGKRLCNTLELPWRNNQSNISCIPRGEYSAFIRYDRKPGWRIQLSNVPGRAGVQIHIGNSPSEIQGCILVGTTFSKNYVGNSRAAYDLLQQELFGDLTLEQIKILQPKHGTITVTTSAVPTMIDINGKSKPASKYA